jgi:hypothetical protein
VAILAKEVQDGGSDGFAEDEIPVIAPVEDGIGGVNQ